MTAAALTYDPQTDQAPRVVASGRGKIAEQIVALAQQYQVPVYEDAELSAALALVNLDEEIPPELYLVVAEVLAYIYRVMHRRIE
uniref:Flagellar biosynthesis n=1 Tax=Bellilinea caldifistulae TaxID=360411 RepID=A0A7C4Q3P8_9CHLR